MKSKKKLVLLFLVSFIVIISSCKTGTESNSEAGNDISTQQNLNESEAVPESEEISDDLADINWNGKKFRILARGGCEDHIQEVWVEAETGDVIDDAVYKRNRTVEERFNITVEATFIDYGIAENQVNKVLETAVRAGDDLYDFAIFHEMFGAKSAMNGLCLNWYSIPHVDFDKPWWASWLIRDYEIAGKSYLALNDMGTNSIIYTACLFFNKQLVQEHELENPYELVRSGKWTIDKFAEYIKGFGQDINGDGAMNENDLYGFTGIPGRCFQFMYASDQTTTVRDSNGIPQIAINSEKMTNIFDKCNEIFKSADTFLSDEFSVPLFKENRALLSTGKLAYALNELRDMETDFGILPYPKYDEVQTDYFTHQDPHGPIMVVPMTVSDLEFVGMMIEALASEGYKTVRPAVYDIALKTKQARDNDSAEMIDIILKGRRSDFGYPFDEWGLAFTLDHLARKNISSFASYYEQRVTAAEKSYADAIELFLNLEY